MREREREREKKELGHEIADSLCIKTFTRADSSSTKRASIYWLLLLHTSFVIAITSLTVQLE